MDWADSRKLRFRLRAACVKVAALALTAASTVVLGIPAIPGRTAIALPMVALVTLISALEPLRRGTRSSPPPSTPGPAA
jgi:hypothetical protein